MNVAAMFMLVATLSVMSLRGWSQTANAPRSGESAAKAISAPNSPGPVAAQEREVLRAAMLPELRRALARTGPGPGADTPEGAWKECTVRAIQLGVLGRVLVVEWNPAQAPNASLIDLYVVQGGRARRIASDCCMGPDVLSGPRDIPDVVFGYTGGVCQEQYSRLRYRDGQYERNACDQMTEGEGGSCKVARCKGKLPTFPNPYPDE